MKTARTPGPWMVGHSDNDIPFIHTERRTICRLKGGYDGEEADARLIAAAPDLLAALRLALPSVEHAYLDVRCHGLGKIADRFEAALKAVDSAIAKAEGTP